jgi:hypothetical protein
LTRSIEGAHWTLDLQPYELVAAKFALPNANFARPQITLEPSVRQSLARRVSDLGTRVAALVNPRPLPVLVNADFEASPIDQQIPGWTITNAAETSGDIDTNERRSGKQSLRLSSRGARISVRSAPIDPPTTGRLSVSLGMKVVNRAHQPSMRLAIEARVDGVEYYRYAAVGGYGPDATRIPDEWDPSSPPTFSYRVDDLPSVGVEDLRVRFDLMGAGEVWIDDVQVFDLGFENTERVELSKLVSLAEHKRNVGQYAGCLQLLESYWPQFLVEHVPLTQGPGPVARRNFHRRRPGSEGPSLPEEPSKKPGVLDRLKGFVPKFSSE